MSPREYQPCSVSAQYGVARENLLSKVILGSFSKLCLMLQILESTKCKCKYFCWVLWQNLWLSNFNSDIKKKKRLLIMRGRWMLLLKRLNAWLWVPSNISLSRPRIFQGQNLLGWAQRKFPRPYPRPEELELQEAGLQKYAKNRPTKQKVQLEKKKPLQVKCYACWHRTTLLPKHHFKDLEMASLAHRQLNCSMKNFWREQNLHSVMYLSRCFYLLSIYLPARFSR